MRYIFNKPKVDLKNLIPGAGENREKYIDILLALNMREEGGRKQHAV